MAAILALGAEPIQPTGEVSALAADASRRPFRVIGGTTKETCIVRFESAPEEPVVLPAAARDLSSARGAGFTSHRATHTRRSIHWLKSPSG